MKKLMEVTSGEDGMLILKPYTLPAIPARDVSTVVRDDWRKDQRRLDAYEPLHPFGERSKRVRSELCDELKFITAVLADMYDVSLFIGYRNKADQDLAVAERRSKTPYPRSKHNKLPSDAVDMAMYPIDFQNEEGFYLLMGAANGIAHAYGIDVRFGGDWDDDGQTDDQTFNDLNHLEVVR